MAHTKAQRAVRGNRDSRSKRLGVKMYGGQIAFPGNIIVRQRGSKFFPGVGAYIAKDFTIHAQVEGTIRFEKKRGKHLIHVETEGTSQTAAQVTATKSTSHTKTEKKEPVKKASKTTSKSEAKDTSEPVAA